MCLSIAEIQTWNATNFEWLQAVLRDANAAGMIWCLFSEGSHLFAYQDKANNRNLLHYIKRSSPYGTVHFIDMSEDVDLSTIYPPTAAGYILCSRPLTTEKWTALGPGQLVVFKNGVIAWAGSTAVDDVHTGTGARLRHCMLLGNVPNPFNGATTIRFAALEKAPVTLQLFDSQGKFLRTVCRRVYAAAGLHAVPFEGMDDNNRPLGNGVYILRLQSKNFSDTRTIVISR
jgi:hypothetical protein